jgi:hypothetical protein
VRSDEWLQSVKISKTLSDRSKSDPNRIELAAREKLVEIKGSKSVRADVNNNGSGEGETQAPLLVSLRG